MSKAPKYPKGDFRRMLMVLAAIDSLQNASLVRIAEFTGIDKKTITNLIAQARVQIHVSIDKVGPVYSIKEWGPVIKEAGAKLALTGALISKEDDEES